MRRWIGAAAVIFLSLARAGAVAAADDVWTLTTGDFASRAVRLLALDDKGARVVPAATGGAVSGAAPAQEQFVPIDQFLQLDRPVTASGAVDAPFILHLTSGDRVSGEPSGMGDESLTWKSRAIGEIAVPLPQIRALAKPDHAWQPSHEPPTEDVVLLSNGDSVSGIIADARPDTLTIHTAAGDSVEITMDTVAAVLFAPVASSAPKAADNAATPPRQFRLRLADGSAVTVAKVAITGADNADVELFDGETRSLPMAQVAAIEQVNGPVSWLSSLTPSETVQMPFLETAWPTMMDKSVVGEPIRAGQRTYSRGIGVHAYSRLAFPLDGGFKAFRTQYAIDGNWPYADVTVRVKLDDKVVHEKAGVRSGAVSPVVLVELGDARSLTLEVDYGSTYDVQDRFNWIEPALLRDLPATTDPAGPATTQPN